MQKLSFRSYIAAGLVLMLCITGLGRIAYATAPYAASGVLGQPDLTTTTLTTSNDHAIAGASDTVIDAVHHRLFVADSGRQRILVFNLDTHDTLLDNTADAVLGQPDFVTDTDHPTSADTLRCDFYCGLAYDSARNLLFVSDRVNNRVLVFDVATITNGEDAVHVIGQPDFTSHTCGNSQNGLCALVGGLVYDAEHQRLIVTETNAKRVLIFDVATITDYMNASYVLGNTTFTSVNTDPPNATNMPGMTYQGIAFDPETQRLYVSDTYDNRVLVFDITPGTITNGKAASHVLGQSNFTSISANTTASTMNSPQGLAWDPVHRQLFVMEYNSCRVLVFDTTTLADGQAATAVIGQPDFTTNTCDAASSQSINPDNVNMGVDTVNHRLYVGDGSNNRVLLYDLAHVANGTLPAGTAQAAYSNSITTSGTQGTKQFSVVSGALPPGLTLNVSSGLLAGTPTAAGTYAFTVKLVDDNGGAGSFWDNNEQTVTIAEPTPSDPGNDNANTSGNGTSATATTPPATLFNKSADTTMLYTSNEPTAEETPGTDQPATNTPLNAMNGYLDGGVVLTLHEGDTLTFCPGGTAQCSAGEQYSVQLNHINVGAGTVNLAFTPGNISVTLALKKPVEVDVNNDHTNDIRATLTATTEQGATISFQNVSNVVKEKEKVPTSTAASQTSDNWGHWAGIGAIAAILIIVLYSLVRARIRKKQ